jgi:two-component system CheB/CheR fusion protein
MDGLGPDLRERYFENGKSGFTFRTDLRRSVIFGRIDMLSDAPISRLQVLTCRNTLMYLNSETQAQVLNRFHFALDDRGILVLGKAETLLSHSALFEPIDRRRRVFRKSKNSAVPGRTADRVQTSPPFEGADDLASAAMDAAPVAMFVVDRSGQLTQTNERARSAFGLSTRDHGRPFQDLEVSYRPVELRTPLEQAYRERRTVIIRGTEWHSRGATVQLDVEVQPLRVGGEVTGALVIFLDVTEQRELEEQLRQSNHDLEHAYEEVQSTNEELETTNEELQSTVEELETTNEELQSTNEELETMNEELQSTNDALHAVNEEVRIRGDEVDELNRFLSAILGSFRGGVVVVDGTRRVRLWNGRAEDLWGLREHEVRGVDFLELDSGLPVGELAATLQSSLDRPGEPLNHVVDAVTRRGKPVRCTVTITPLQSGRGADGAIMTMEVDPPA